MSIPVNSICIQCHFNKSFSHIKELGTEADAMAYARKIMAELLNAPEDMDSALLGAIGTRIVNEMFGIDRDQMQEEKRISNQFVLERLSQVRREAEAAEDPVYRALQFAVLGNYLDFSALKGQVSFEKLEDMLKEASRIQLDKECYGQFCKDLETAEKLLYITDNAGEIVFDRLLAELLKEKYSQLQITFCVRGKPVSNDATREDAKVAQIPFPVIDNGTDIGGTVLRLCGDELQNAIREADVVLAKGMGNTESMYGCGYNVYYAFLVKCERFVQFFQKPMMTPMFIKDK